MALTGINGKVALITGASGSIGSGTAVAFAQLGAKLALTGRDKTKLEATATRCIKAGATEDQIFIITGDVTSKEDVQSVVGSTVENFGRIDILVNCAGIIKPGVFLTTKMDDFDIIFKTNLRGTFLICKNVMPHIVKSKGNIVNLSSYAGMRPAYANFAYGMAEATLDQFTKALALELGPQGVRVNAVNPGVVSNTDSWTRPGAPFAAKANEMDKIEEGLKKMYPMKRIGEISDITNAITFLCSDNASFIHGVTLPVDGGKVLTSKAAIADKAQS